MSDRIWHEGIIDIPSVRELASVSPVTLLEIVPQPLDVSASPAQAAGAQQVYWKDLLWHADVREFANAGQLRQRLAALGSPTDSALVVYGTHRQYGFYTYWALRYAGLGPVFILERPEQLRAALPKPEANAPRLIIKSGATPKRVLRQDVLDAVRLGHVQIVDARTQDEYDGWCVSPPGPDNHGAERAGHIPGARHLHYRDFFDETDTLLPQDALQERVRASGLSPDTAVIVYCRLSHRASVVAYVLRERLGFSDVRLYDGSWTEWGSTVGSPIAHHRPCAP